MIGHTSFRDLSAIFFREMAAGIFIGAIVYLWKTSVLLGAALAFSMVVTIFVSGVIGLCLPIIFRKFKIDPAIASGPLVLAICDIQTLVVYFSASAWILSRASF